MLTATYWRHAYEDTRTPQRVEQSSFGQTITEETSTCPIVQMPATASHGGSQHAAAAAAAALASGHGGTYCRGHTPKHTGALTVGRWGCKASMP